LVGGIGIGGYSLIKVSQAFFSIPGWLEGIFGKKEGIKLVTKKIRRKGIWVLG